VTRLLDQLVNAGVAHGDVHERNLVFHVPEAREQIAPGHIETLDEYCANKTIIMDAINAGPRGGRARLLLIDFGGAREVRGRVERFIAKSFIERHLVDPDEEPPPPLSTLRSCHERGC
jgi:predicted unusual protein kinase regulating ubiquinone biosynthesis (AarF/ABC1/UbiB family)